MCKSRDETERGRSSSIKGKKSNIFFEIYTSKGHLLKINKKAVQNSNSAYTIFVSISLARKISPQIYKGNNS